MPSSDCWLSNLSALHYISKDSGNSKKKVNEQAMLSKRPFGTILGHKYSFVGNLEPYDPPPPPPKRKKTPALICQGGLFLKKKIYSDDHLDPKIPHKKFGVLQPFPLGGVLIYIYIYNSIIVRFSIFVCVCLPSPPRHLFLQG